MCLRRVAICMVLLGPEKNLQRGTNGISIVSFTALQACLVCAEFARQPLRAKESIRSKNSMPSQRRSSRLRWLSHHAGIITRGISVGG